MNKQNEHVGTTLIPSSIVKHLIGKDGAMIRVIKGLTGTRIYFGTANKTDQTEVIVKSNTQRNVAEAIARISKFQTKYEGQIAAGKFRGCQNDPDFCNPLGDIEAVACSSKQLSGSQVDNKELNDIQLNPSKNLQVSVDNLGNGLFKSIVTIPVQSVPHFFGKEGWRIKLLRKDTNTWIFPVNATPCDEKCWKPDSEKDGITRFAVVARDERNVQRAVCKINGFKTGFRKGTLKGPLLSQQTDDEPKSWKFDISGLVDRPPNSRVNTKK